VLALHWKTALVETLPKECLVEVTAYQSQMTVTKINYFPSGQTLTQKTG
jgi:hypothetical protein